MNKPIDPNLNDSFDFELDLLDSSRKPAQKESVVKEPEEYDGDMVLKEKSSSSEHHHSSGEHHHSSGEHHHSSGEHHHSSSEHHHSSSEHHHSSGEHHHSSGEHHHSSGEHHHSSSGHHHSSGEHHHSSSGHHHSSGSKKHSSHSHSHSSKKKKSKMPVAAKLAIAFLLIILLLIFAVIGAFFFLEARGKSDLTNNMTVSNDYQEVIEHNGHKYVYNDDIVTIAFMGIDKRNLDDETETGLAGQADSDLVIAVDTKTGKTKVIAIPRDTMVDVDVYSENGIYLRNENMQLCLSYAYGDGGESSAKNVTTSVSRILYNVPINKYFALDLNGIAPINDSIGGVTVQSLYDFPDRNIKKGDTIHLTGDMTEAYVRRRDMDSVDASLNRTDRQVQYIKAFAAQLLPSVINDFGVVRRLYSTAMSYSSTDIELSNATYLASRLLSQGIESFETTTLKGDMKLSDKPDTTGRVYAEFHADKEATLETVLDTFYVQVD